MKSQKIVVKKKIESREVADVVYHANKYTSRICMKFGGSSFNIKSLMGMFALHLEPKMEVFLETEGEDEQEAMQQMLAIFE